MSEIEVTHDTQIENNDDLDTFSTDFFGEKKVDEPAAKPEVEQEVLDDTDVEDTEAQKTDDEDVTEDTVLEEEPPKKKTVQDRINEVVKQREEYKREADAKIAELERKFEDFQKAREPAKIEQKVDEPQPDSLNEDGSAKYTLGEFDPNYIKDLTRFTLNTERAQAAIEDEKQRQAKVVNDQQVALHQSWTEKVNSSQEKYPDFNEKGQTLLDGFNNLDPNYAQYLSTVLMSMEYGPDVLYYLSNNKDEAVKIVNSGAQNATLALGRIEAKFIDVEAQKLLAKPKVSKAPPPPSVQSRGTGGGATSVPADTDDLDAFTKEFFRKRK